MKHLSPRPFIGLIGDYPLWGLTGIVLFGVVVCGLRLRLPIGGSPVGDAGLVILNVYIGLEWGGGGM